MDRYENWNYIGSATEYEGVVLFSSSSKLLRYELEKLKERQRHIREKLTAFEERYGQKAEEFLPGFREGKLGDEMDFFEWSVLAEIHQELSQQLAEGERINNGSADLGITQ